MKPIDKFFANFFTSENLASTATSAKVFAQASVVFLVKNSDSLKLISLLITILLLVGVIHSLKRGVKETKKLHSISLKDVFGLKPTFYARSLKAWGTIQERLKTKEEGQLKLAIIEADRLFDHVITSIGYKGENFEERFGQLTPSQFSNLKDLGEAHEIAEKLLTEPALEISYEGAERIIGVYKKAFEDIRLIEPES